mgnify:CR=1 FL=1
MGPNPANAVHMPTKGEAPGFACARRLVAGVQEPILFSDRRLSVTASIGVALQPADGGRAKTMLSHADSAMYYAKRQGLGVATFTDARTGGSDADAA